MEKDLIIKEEEPPEGGGKEEKKDWRAHDTVQRLWPSVSDRQWYDWQWQYANRLKSADALSLLFPHDAGLVESLKQVIPVYRYALTPYYLSLINWSDENDPLRKQCVPDRDELTCPAAADEDPLEEEEDMQVPGLVHRYPDRVLAVVTRKCILYCRHCTRKRAWREGEAARSGQELSAMVDYVRKTPQIREVVLSGGDPLAMPLETLDWLLGEFAMIDHVEVLRLGTRIPVVLPMAVTGDLVHLLRKHRPLWLNTQFNHPREVTGDAAAACDRILSAGIPVSNQSVLLKGINDSPAVMKHLCQSLQRIMVRPYYLFQCDPVRGVEHFRTSVWKGMEIMEALRGNVGGLCIPLFVVDAPGGGGKIPVAPSYLLSASDNELLLRNYEGLIIRYYNPGQNNEEGTRQKTAPAAPHRPGAQAAQGTALHSCPQTPRHRRRLSKSPYRA